MVWPLFPAVVFECIFILDPIIITKKMGKEITRRIIGNKNTRQQTINIPRGTFKPGTMVKIVEISTEEVVCKIKPETYAYFERESSLQTDKRLNTPETLCAKILNDYASEKLLDRIRNQKKN